MGRLITGTIFLAASAGLMRASMPASNGKPRWFVNTQVEPYVAVTVTVLALLGIGLVITAAVNALA